MSVEFYLANETHKKVTGELVELKDVLYFKQERSGFDGKATKDHVEQYPGQYETFRREHPDFVLPVSFSGVEIGSPTAKRQVDPVELQEL